MAILLTSFESIKICGINGQMQEGPTAQLNPDLLEAMAELPKPSLMEITKEMYFGDASDYPDLKAEFMREFEKKYGIELKVNSPLRNDYVERVNLMINAGDIKGMLHYFVPTDVRKARNDGVIEPLDDYLKDNKYWNSFPEEFREFFKFEDGKIWALPSQITLNLFDRAIRKDWLDNLNLPVPKTLDDLYNVAEAFTLYDPDGNGKNDTFGLVTVDSWNIQDIFQANGCRLNNVGDASITYDPEKKLWVDTMLYPAMIDTLEYLHRMYKNGYLDREMFTNNRSRFIDKFYDSQAGSWYYWYGTGFSAENVQRTTNKNAEVIEIPALTGKIAQNINSMEYSGAPFVLLKGTSQPKEVVNWFVNIFYGDEEGHWLGYYGLPKYNSFDFQNKKINRSVDPESLNQQSAYSSPAIVGDFPWFFSGNYRITIGSNAGQIEKADMLQNKKQSVVDEGIKSGVIYELSPQYDTPKSETWTTLAADVRKVFKETLINAITGDLPVEKAIEEYRIKMRKIGSQKILDEANNSLGKKSDQVY